MPPKSRRRLRSNSHCESEKGKGEVTLEGEELILITRKFPWGDIYEGSIDRLTGKRQGFGFYAWANGDKYKGNWEAGFQEGQGSQYWSNGESFVGEWSQGLPRRGIKTNGDGSIVRGTFVHGKANGWCDVTRPNGDSYEGFYQNDKRHGSFGRYQWGSVKGVSLEYDGAWESDTMTGIGSTTCNSLTPASSNVRCLKKYDGQHVNNLQHGLGTATYSDGSFFSGDFVDDKKMGWGRQQEGEGEGWLVYLGDYEGDERHGMGMLRFSENEGGNEWNDGGETNSNNGGVDDDDDDDDNDGERHLNADPQVLEEVEAEINDIKRLFCKAFDVESALCEFGGQFRGEFRHGQPHGWGVITLGNGRGRGGRRGGGPRRKERTLRGKFIRGRYLPSHN